MANSCVLYMPMDEGVGTTVADLAGGNNGTLHGTTGTADAGTDQTQLVDAPLSATDDIYNGCQLKATSGAANGNLVLISDYNGTTKTATFATNLVGFASGDTYEIYPAWVDGKYGKALSFNGVNDYVTCGNSLSLSVSELTFSCWVYTKSMANQERIWHYFVDSNHIAGVYYSGNKFCFFIWHQGVTDYSIISNAVVSLNVWNHLLIRIGVDGAKMFINGVQQTQTNADTACLDDLGQGTLYFATYSGGSVFGDINLDEVRIYNRDLNADERRELYETVPVGRLSLKKFQRRGVP